MTVDCWQQKEIVVRVDQKRSVGMEVKVDNGCNGRRV